MFRKLLLKTAVTVGVVLGVSQTHLAASHTASGVAKAAIATAPALAARPLAAQSAKAPGQSDGARPEAKTVLTRSANWFVYPAGCQGLAQGYDLVIHFHGAHTTVIPRYLKSQLNAVLVIVNKGIGSGAYSDALALPSHVDGLLERIELTIAEECGKPTRAPKRVALSSWSAGYGAVQQFLRFRPEFVDAVLLSDGLHVGFANEKRRSIRVKQMDEFVRFAKQAAQGQRLMAIAHSAITPSEYAGAGETAMALADAVHAPAWPVTRDLHGMTQLTESRRGQFFVDGFAGADKAAHARHLYSIHRTSFARLRDYWQEP